MVIASIPTLQYGVVDHVNQCESEISACPHCPWCSSRHERCDIIVADVSLRAIPGLQPALIDKIVTGDSSVLETDVKYVANLHRTCPLSIIASIPNFDYRAVEGIDYSGPIVGAGIDSVVTHLSN